MDYDLPPAYASTDAPLAPRVRRQLTSFNGMRTIGNDGEDSATRAPVEEASVAAPLPAPQPAAEKSWKPAEVVWNNPIQWIRTNDMR